MSASITTQLPARTSARVRSGVVSRRRIHPRPSAELSQLTRYRGGTYSHTVDTIVLADGTSARTDLIRLNPNIEAYSLDFGGLAPTKPSRYRVETWSAVPNLQACKVEPEVDWILRNSYPRLRPAELSRRVRAAGYPLGDANIAEHEAIAATQAAIWFLTNGMALDTRALNEPVAVDTATPGAWTFEFDGDPQLGGYSLRATSKQPVTVSLQKSVDGIAWEDVATSRLSIAEGRGQYSKTLGVGATLSAGGNGLASRGYRYYRLVVDAEQPAGIAIIDVQFWLHGSPNHRNSHRIVALYHYLLAGAREARRRTVSPELDAADAIADGVVVGPFRLRVTDDAAVAVSGSHSLIDADGAELVGAVAPGQDFYLRCVPGSSAATITAIVPGTPNGLGGRVLTGVARDAGRFTPVALAVPTRLVVDFDIRWDATLAAPGWPGMPIARSSGAAS
jgi:TQXA domain-containing protein